MSSYKEVSKGKLLIADPYLFDPHFKRSVVLLTGHSEEEGTIGFILNKPLQMNVENLLSDFPNLEARVYFGGPVSTETIHFIHSAGDILDDSVAIGPGLYWGGNYDKLKFLIQNGLITANNIRFFVGYSGWETGQLEYEMKDQSSWMVGENHSNYVFKSVAKKLWKQVLSNKGNHYSIIAEMPEEFILN